MAQDIQPYRDDTIDAPLGFVEVPATPMEAHQPSAGLQLFQALRRRWRTILLVFVLLAGGGIPYIWLTGMLTYTATAKLDVAPNQTSILYEDQRSQIQPYFSQYLNGQIHRISTAVVLGAALADPDVQGLEILQAPDPVTALRRAMLVEQIGGTNLLGINVTQVDRDAALRLTRAVVRAYMANVVAGEASEQRETLEVLEKEREQLQADREALQNKIHTLGQADGTASDAMIDLLREDILEATRETKKELDRTEIQIIQLTERLKQLEQEGAAASLATDDAAAREQAFASDPMISSLQAQIIEVTDHLVELTKNLTEEHEAVVKARDRKKWLESELEKERTRRAAEVEVMLRQKRERDFEKEKTRLRQELAAAERSRDALNQRIEARNEQGLALGKRGLEIQALKQQLESLDDRYQRVDGRIKQLDIESQRPGRVTLMSEAEILPSGIRDGRPKKTVAVIAGALFVALFAGLMKDRMDPRLRGPFEVEAGMGLPVLGAVPCLSELKSGAVTQEDLIESYRVVRAALCGVQPDGSPPRSILITSAQAGEGKTSLAVSLAASLAEPGVRVLLIDGDLQAPVIGHLLKISPMDGLRSVLRGEREIKDAVLKSPLRGVDVLVADSNGGSARGALNNRTANRLATEVFPLYDHIVIDSPPVLGAADALVWAKIVDGVIVSSLAGQSDRIAMRLACQRLRTVNARLLGAVVGNVPRKDSYYSTSSYRYDEDNAAHAWATDKGRNLTLPELPDDVTS